jgi:hypothetical protein
VPTANIVPDGDFTTEWDKTQPGTPETHFDKLDEGTSAPEDSDYVESGTLGAVDQFTLTASPGDLSTLTQVDINYRAMITDPSRMRTIQLDLFHTDSVTAVTGNPQIVTVEDLGGSGVLATVQKSWTGLSLTKAQADSLECRTTHSSLV